MEKGIDRTEGTSNMKSDLIERQAAIDAILAVTGNSSVRELYEHVQEHGLSEMWSGGVNAAIDIIIAVPSAQPDHNADIDKKVGLECLICKQTYDYSWDTMDEISYTMYSYCPDCIRKGILLLKAQDKEGAQDG